MLNLKTNRLFQTLTIFTTALVVIVGCREHSFKGEGNVKKAPPLCSEVEAIDGINVAFLIDNSSSNNATDCPNRAYVGKNAVDPSISEYECRSATNREKAVLSTFDFLKGFKPKDKNAISQFGIASFPTASDLFDGWEIRSKDWLQVMPDIRPQVESSMAFTRRPLGTTPYRAAMEAGIKLYTGLNDHGKPKLAFLVTDGEPTDEDAPAAKKAGEKFRKMGVKVITVFVTGSQARDQRRSEHMLYLQRIKRDQANIDELLGLNGKQSVVDAISDQKIEVTDSSKLEAVFKDVIKNTVNCREN